ncbi:hypothetical protein DITRI_Ditri06bG0026800 [Diplodiscus trichospermus]
MRIRNNGTLPQLSLSPPPDLLSSSILQPPPSPPPYQPTISSPTKPMMMNTHPSSSPSNQQPPHVMTSRINARLSSHIDNGADFKDTTDDSCSLPTNESFRHGVFCQTSTSSSVSSSLSYNGRWCEEERAIPLKKRKVVMVSYETNQSKEIMKKDALMEERKQEMGEKERCNRTNGKGWRCNKQRVKGSRLCKHHLELQRVTNTNSPSTRSNQGERVSIAGRAADRENKRMRMVRARSMTSLLRDTVPLLY